MVRTLESYVGGRWHPATGDRPLRDATTGAEVARISSEPLDYAAVLSYGRSVGGPVLRSLGFADRARILKDLGKYLNSHLDEFHALSTRTGATRRDS